MDNYLLIKFIHILSGTVLAGTGIGIAYFMFMVNRSDNIQAIAVTVRNVVLADWIFTTPAIIIQLITGIWLMKLLHYSFSSAWFIAVTGLFMLIGCCWIPVVFIQYKLKEIAERQQAGNIQFDGQYKKLMKLWISLGLPAFAAILIIFWLMVVKPLSVV